VCPYPGPHHTDHQVLSGSTSLSISLTQQEASGPGLGLHPCSVSNRDRRVGGDDKSPGTEYRLTDVRLAATFNSHRRAKTMPCLFTNIQTKKANQRAPGNENSQMFLRTQVQEHKTAHNGGRVYFPDSM
jgi:hypothetical protein